MKALTVIEHRQTSSKLPKAFIYRCNYCGRNVGFGVQAIKHMEEAHGLRRNMVMASIEEATTGYLCPTCGLPSAEFVADFAAPGDGAHYECKACGADLVELSRRLYAVDAVDVIC